MSWQFYDGIRFGSFGDSAFILDVSGGKYFSINEAGTAICRGIQDNQNTEAIIKRLQDQFPVQPAEQIASDVQSFLARLEQLRLCRCQPR